MDNVLEVQHLVKNYGSYQAVKDISFTIPKGNIIGLLGPNGAGKTTTIQMLLGITECTAGSIRYFGQDFFQHRVDCLQRINFASSFNTLQGRITVWENLLVFAKLYSVHQPKQKIRQLIEYFQIDHLTSQRYWDLSAGQKTRVNLIKALLNDPELILMDEPTASLDPDIADKVISLIEQLKHERQLSVLYTSHDMAEVTRLCDQVIFLDHGEIVAQDTPLGLTKRIATAKLQLVVDGTVTMLKKFLDQHNLTYHFLNEFTVVIDTPEAQIPQLIFDVSQLGLLITDIEVKKPTLEDVFLHIARKTLG